MYFLWWFLKLLSFDTHLRAIWEIIKENTHEGIKNSRFLAQFICIFFDDFSKRSPSIHIWDCFEKSLKKIHTNVAKNISLSSCSFLLRTHFSVTSVQTRLTCSLFYLVSFVVNSPRVLLKFGWVSVDILRSRGHPSPRIFFFWCDTATFCGWVG